MKIDLSGLSIDELIEVRDQINNMIWDYSDGFFYICNVRSYGRNWVNNLTNSHNVQELCDQYNGDDGIVDVYSNNPHLVIHNYGDVKFVPTKDDYSSWKNYNNLVHIVKSLEKELEEWDNRDNVPFNQRKSYFAPVYDREQLEEFKKELVEFDMNFVVPVNYKK